MLLTNLNTKRMNLSVGDDFMVDRINNLPDGVISHILSFLPSTKEVVATSILAKQWRYLWTSIDKFDFEDDIYGVSVVNVRKYFAPFVYRVLKLHQGNIKELELSCSNCGCKELDVTNWINNVTARGVERLVLSTLLMRYTCPLSIFTCKTLVDLKIYNYDICNMNISSEPFFPCMKKLHIEYLMYYIESLKHFILQCSDLEHFVLSVCMSMKVIPIEIVSSTLKRIELASPHHSFDEKIHLRVPSLEHLRFWYVLPPEISMEEKLASLVEGDINFVFSSLKVNLKQLRESFVRFIQHFANVKVLRMNCDRMKFLTSVGHARFHNLTKLEIHSSYFEWRLLVYFMES